MSYASPELEREIASRALALSEALAVSHANAPSFLAARDHFRDRVASQDLPIDEMTWFAMDRVARQVGLPAIRLGAEATPVPAGALVFIPANIEPPSGAAAPVLAALRSASFVVAPASWGQSLKQAGIQGYSVESLSAAPQPSPRKSGPSP